MEANSKNGDEAFCPHCGIEVARKTYLAHRRLYFDSDTDQWVKRKALCGDHLSKSRTSTIALVPVVL